MDNRAMVHGISKSWTRLTDQHTHTHTHTHTLISSLNATSSRSRVRTHTHTFSLLTLTPSAICCYLGRTHVLVPRETAPSAGQRLPCTCLGEKSPVKLSNSSQPCRRPNRKPCYPEVLIRLEKPFCVRLLRNQLYRHKIDNLCSCGRENNWASWLR